MLGFALSISASDGHADGQDDAVQRACVRAYVVHAVDTATVAGLQCFSIQPPPAEWIRRGQPTDTPRHASGDSSAQSRWQVDLHSSYRGCAKCGEGHRTTMCRGAVAGLQIVLLYCSHFTPCSLSARAS
eukprot:343940-Chlamydomonas_euryale.AAC.11